MVRSLFAVSFGAVLFLGLFAADVLASISILFYRGVLIALLAVAIQWIVLSALALARGKRGIALQRTALCAITFSLLLTFLVTVPVTIDRSVTVFLLGTLADTPGGVTKDELKTTLVNRYVIEYDAVERRMQEQARSGNVERHADGYSLTTQGWAFIEGSRFLARIMKIDLKYLHPGIALAQARSASLPPQQEESQSNVSASSDASTAQPEPPAPAQVPE